MPAIPPPVPYLNPEMMPRGNFALRTCFIWRKKKHTEKNKDITIKKSIYTRIKYKTRPIYANR